MVFKKHFCRTTALHAGTAPTHMGYQLFTNTYFHALASSNLSAITSTIFIILSPLSMWMLELRLVQNYCDVKLYGIKKRGEKRKQWLTSFVANPDSKRKVDISFQSSLLFQLTPTKDGPMFTLVLRLLRLL